MRNSLSVGIESPAKNMHAIGHHDEGASAYIGSAYAEKKPFIGV
jgi:hypothetical protein